VPQTANGNSADKIVRAFANQADACRILGSPFTARLCELLAIEIGNLGGAVAERLRDWPGDPGHRADAVPLRLAAGLHALVLTGACKALASVYPPHHEHAGEDALRSAVRHALSEHDSHVLDWLASPPRTNEIRRSSALYFGLGVLAGRTGLPLMLSEIGAAGGLNLLLDHYCHHLDGVQLGTRGASIELRPDWHGPQPAADTVRIAERAGCDRMPFDFTSASDRVSALAYIWADQADRIGWTRQGMTVAAEERLRIDRADAAEFVERRFGVAPPGDMVHVLMHSIVWQYLDSPTRQRIRNAMERAGNIATAKCPVAWLAMEGDGERPGAGLTLTLWPGGVRKPLARVDFHGRWVDAAAKDSSARPALS